MPFIDVAFLQIICFLYERKENGKLCWLKILDPDETVRSIYVMRLHLNGFLYNLNTRINV